MSMFYSQAEIKNLLNTNDIVPVVSLIPMNFDSSLSIFLKVKGNFLLESAESAESIGRYSFIAITENRKFILHDTTIEDWKRNNSNGELELIQTETMKNPLDYVSHYMKSFCIDQDSWYQLPPFWGGFIGYFGYEGIQYFETIENLKKKSLLDIPLGIFIIPKQLLIVDHLKRQLWIISYIEKQELEKNDISFENMFSLITKEHEEIIEKVTAPLPYIAWEYEKSIQERSIRVSDIKNLSTIDKLSALENMLEPQYHTSEDEFKENIRYCIERIYAGDIIQVVTSRQISIDFQHKDEFMFYLRLRNVNPSPYMFFLRFEDFTIIGSSPESMVSLDENKTMSIKPIAGTIRRGNTKKEEAMLQNTLISDEKERAEHLMLVDLARNDLHRISVPGTVTVPDFMQIQAFSHVFHIISNVKGTLCSEYDGFDLIKAIFPAGTLSGAPKIEAMNIIGRTELYMRNVYGGMIIVMGFNTYMDSCIAIRTTVVHKNRAYLQAGAGIVVDSNEEKEWQETELKLGALLQSFVDIRE